MAKYRFKVRDGIHKDGPPGAVVTYKKGDIVESDYPLDKMFVNKFDRLMSGKKGRKDDDEIVVEEPSEKEQAKALQEAQEIARKADEAEDDVQPLKGRTLIEDVERADEEDTDHARDPEPEEDEAPPVKKRRRKKRRTE